MGRRKIEIQPITHERNRSVTFLKRKNGLFKKAYELGVLCSVDVAVIIFEERPGHHVKLYQYGSSDIQDIVQRHLRHDGEKDTRGPADFSGNPNIKVDEGDGDEDDVDDDDDVPRHNKRRHDGKLKPATDLVNGDYNHRLSIPQPPNLSVHGLGNQSGGPALHTSNERGLRDNGSKRSRIGVHPHEHSRSPSDDPSNGYGYGHSTTNSASPYGNSRSAGGYAHHSSSQHHGGGSQYPPFFPENSPQAPFLPTQSTRGASGGYNIAPHRNSASGSYDSAMYPNMLGRGGAPMPGSASNGSGDMFNGFLDPNDQGRHQSQPQQNFGLDWPVHGGGGSGPSASSSSVSNHSLASSTGPDPSGQNPNGGNWLDFLSGNNPNAGTPASGGRHGEALSWERGGGNPHSADMFGPGDHRGRLGAAGSPMVPGIGKRSSPVGALLGSPLTRDDGKVIKEVGAG